MRPLAVAALGLLCFACGEAEVRTYTVEDGPGVTLCLNGAGADSHPGNSVVADLCQDLPGLVRGCDDAGCRADFRFSDVEGLLGGLQAAVDARHEAGESVRPLSLVGYSFGAVNLLEQVLPAFANDPVLSDLAVDRLVLIDPFRPLVRSPLEVDVRVRAAWNYRHSVAPEEDCSARPGLHIGYEGARILCADTSRCRDYDFSRTSPDIDHCTVTDAAAPAARDNVIEGVDGDARDLPIPDDATGLEPRPPL